MVVTKKMFVKENFVFERLFLTVQSRYTSPAASCRRVRDKSLIVRAPPRPELDPGKRGEAKLMER